MGGFHTLCNMWGTVLPTLMLALLSNAATAGPASLALTEQLLIPRGQCVTVLCQSPGPLLIPAALQASCTSIKCRAACEWGRTRCHCTLHAQVICHHFVALPCRRVAALTLTAATGHFRLSSAHCLLQGLTEDEEQRRAARDVGDDVIPNAHKPREATIKEDAEQVVPVRLDSGKPKEEGMERAAKAAREDAQVGLEGHAHLVCCLGTAGVCAACGAVEQSGGLPCGETDRAGWVS